MQSFVLTPTTLRLCGTKESWLDSVIVTWAPDFTVIEAGVKLMFFAVTVGVLLVPCEGTLVAVGGGGTGVSVGGGGGTGVSVGGGGGGGVSVGGTSVGGTSVGVAGSGVAVAGALVAVATADVAVVVGVPAAEVAFVETVALTRGVGEVRDGIEVGVLLLLLLPPQATSSTVSTPAARAVNGLTAALPVMAIRIFRYQNKYAGLVDYAPAFRHRADSRSVTPGLWINRSPSPPL